MRKSVFILCPLLLVICSSSLFAQYYFFQPESAVFDTIKNRYLISNVGTGDIVQITSQLDTSYFYTEFTRAAGIHIRDDKFYVSCQSGVAVFDLNADVLDTIIPVPGSDFLNDITTDTGGYLYVTDHTLGKVFRIDLSDYSAKLIIDKIFYPNGVHFDKEHNRILMVNNGAYPPIYSLERRIWNETVGTPAAIGQGGDDLANATVITTLPATLSGSTVGYTNDYEAFGGDCSRTYAPDVVYAYTPPQDYTMSLRSCDSDYWVKLFIFEEYEDNLIACNQYSDSCLPEYRGEIYNLEIDSGKTYYIIVDGGIGGLSGDYEINIEIPQEYYDTSIVVNTVLHGMDGITADNDGNYYVSTWLYNAVFRFDPDFSEPPVQMTCNHNGPADIYYDVYHDILVVPNYYSDSVDFITLSEPPFAKVTGQSPVTDGGATWGISWIDYDNDGFDDLFASNIPDGGFRNNLYHNNGDGSFTKITDDIIVDDPESRGGGTSWGDYDNDGLIDGIVVNWDPYFNFVYHNDGDSFSRVSYDVITNDPGLLICPAWGDLDNDGDLDLFIGTHNESSGHLLFINDDTGFVKITSGPPVEDIVGANGVSLTDYDNDGDLDIFIATIKFNSSGDNFLYINDGAGNFTRMTGDPLVSSGGNSFGSSWGDIDNDGDLDVFVTNAYPAETAKNELYLNNGDGSFTRVTTGPLVSDTGDSFGSAWGDYDNDGDLDLVVANGKYDTKEKNFLYENDGTGNFTRIMYGYVAHDSASSESVAWADYDRDGDLDLYIGNSYGMNETNLLYRNKGNDNNWINIKCVGQRTNTSAIGVKVRAKATISGNPTWQIREISSLTGKNGQNSLNVHFGLGDAAIIDSLIIEWINTPHQVLTDVPVNQFLIITEEISYECGDANDDEAINLLDILFLIDHVYGTPQGPPPDPPEAGDANADGNINLLDILYLIDYLYGTPQGPEPLCP
ncbi:MAG: VCBS repeat-containing protein [candidate division Zixibacteria bacterium]|nr:VCBS repeat-containing protein [candidate division Zixibacteria bacterium]